MSDAKNIIEKLRMVSVPRELLERLLNETVVFADGAGYATRNLTCVFCGCDHYEEHKPDCTYIQIEKLIQVETNAD